jgi:hypothetical protein
MRTTVVIALLFFTALPARAGESGHRLVAGAKPVSLTSIVHGELSTHWGGGAFIEYAVLPHLLEVELSVAALESHDVVVPIDLLLKYPFFHSDALVAFVGAGPLVSILISGEHNDGHGHITEGGTETSFGFATVLGVYWWFQPAIGVLAQASYNGVWEHDEYVSEVGGALGIAFRF